MNTVFLKDDGSVWIIGGNGLGQKGDGSISDYIRTPARVLGPDNEKIYSNSGNFTNSINLTQPVLNSSSTRPVNTTREPAINTWMSLGVLVLAIVIFATGCIVYLTVIRKM